jgi:predicted HD superfamily hydrolase involved in NAD metabolism
MNKVQIYHEKYQEIFRDVEGILSPKRFRHSLGVVEIAIALAHQYDVDIDKAYLSALLHDIARELNQEKLEQLALHFGYSIDIIEAQSPVLLHAPIGALLIEEKYQIRDEKIRNAIRFHTTGCTKMHKLDMIIYIADMIEPNRNYEGVKELRQLAHKSLEQCMLEGLDQTIIYTVEKKKLIHPLTIEARNYILMKRGK